MKKEFFILSSGEDGTDINGPLTEDELLEMITPNKHGETYFGGDLSFLSEVPDSDKGCWNCDDNAVLIIKGEVVVPKPKTTVQGWSL